MIMNWCWHDSVRYLKLIVHLENTYIEKIKCFEEQEYDLWHERTVWPEKPNEHQLYQTFSQFPGSCIEWQRPHLSIFQQVRCVYYDGPIEERTSVTWTVPNFFTTSTVLKFFDPVATSGVKTFCRHWNVCLVLGWDSKSVSILNFTLTSSSSRAPRFVTIIFWIQCIVS